VPNPSPRSRALSHTDDWGPDPRGRALAPTCPSRQANWLLPARNCIASVALQSLDATVAQSYS
jgi:hypothetical protein